MRNSIKLAGIALFLGAFSFSVLTQKRVFTSDQTSRDPASVQLKVLDDSLVMPANAQVTAYHFERAIRAELKDKSMKPLLNLNLQGTVFLTELSHTEDARLVNLQFELSQGNEKEVHQSHLPFVVELTRDQNIKSIHLHKTLDPTDEDDFNVLKDFLSVYAYGSNRDTTGTYQFKLDREGNRVQKTKLKYDHQAFQSMSILASDTHGEVEANLGSWITAVGTETTRMDGMGKSSLVTTSTFKIEKLNPGLKPKVAIQSLLDMQEGSMALVSQNSFAPRSWKVLKLELAQIKLLSRTKRLSLFHDLAKLLKMDPSALLEFRKYIEAMSKEPGLMTFGIGVLATAGTDVAQATLVDWYHGGYGVEHTVLNAFSSASVQLTDSTLGFLKDIVAARDTAPDLAQNAAYALGSALKHTDDESTRAALSAYFAASTNESDKLTALDAMGNSGDAHFLPTLQTAIQSTDAGEREKAVFAARFLPAETAAPILMAGYQDGALAVKNASVRALAFQENLSVHAPLIQQCASAGNSSCQTMLKQLNP